MASRKYLGDYRLENVEKKGKLRTVAVYKGKGYRFSDPSALSRTRVPLVCFAAAFWLFQLLALTVRTSCAHYIFVIMPMVFAMLPFWFASLGIYTALTAKGDLTREQAEKLQPRLAGGSVIAAFLSGAAFIGSIAAFVIARKSPSAGDIVFILSTAAQTAAAVLCFTRRDCVRTEEAASV